MLEVHLPCVHQSSLSLSLSNNKQLYEEILVAVVAADNSFELLGGRTNGTPEREREQRKVCVCVRESVCVCAYDVFEWSVAVVATECLSVCTALSLSVNPVRAMMWPLSQFCSFELDWKVFCRSNKGRGEEFIWMNKPSHANIVIRITAKVN